MSFEEMQYDDNTIVTANVVREDNSFDTPLGRKREIDYVVEDLHVVTYIGNFDFDITSSLSEKWLEYFKNWVLEKYIEKNVA